MERRGSTGEAAAARPEEETPAGIGGGGDAGELGSGGDGACEEGARVRGSHGEEEEKGEGIKRIKERGKGEEREGSRDPIAKQKDFSVRWRDTNLKLEEGRRVAAKHRGWERKTARGN